MTQHTAFDIQALGRAFEAGAADKVLAFYTADHEHIEIDAEAPPNAPRVRKGADAVEYLRNAVESLCDNNATIHVENPVVGDDRAACTIACNFPDGRRLLANTIYDLSAGKIVRQLDIQVMDPRWR